MSFFRLHRGKFKSSLPPKLSSLRTQSALTHLVDSDGIRGGTQPSFAQRLNVDDVVVLLPGEGQLGCWIGRGERVYLFMSLSPVGQLSWGRKTRWVTLCKHAHLLPDSRERAGAREGFFFFSPTHACCDAPWQCDTHLVSCNFWLRFHRHHRFPVERQLRAN